MDRIQKEIEKRARQMENSLTDYEVFGSDKFRSLMQDLLDSMVPESENMRIMIRPFTSSGENISGCTDGNRIELGYRAPMVQYYSSQDSRYLTLKGVFFHEVGHVLFNDFETESKCLTRLRLGEWPCEKPKVDPAVLAELEEAIKDGRYNQILGTLFSDLVNCTVDPHDEEKMIERFGRHVERCISFSRESLRSRLSPLEVLSEQPPFQVLTSLVLQYARYGEIYAKRQSTLLRSEYMKALNMVSDHIDKAKTTDSMEERYNELSYVVAAIWPFIKEELNPENKSENSNESENQDDHQESQENQAGDSGNSQSSQNEQNGSQSQSGNEGSSSDGAQSGESQEKQKAQLPKISEEQMDEILNMIQNAAQQNGATRIPFHRATLSQNQEESIGHQKAEPKNEAAENKAPGEPEEEEKRDISRIRNEIAEEKAESEMEKIQSSHINSELHETEREMYPLSRIRLRVFRPSDVCEEDIDEYNRCMKELSPVSKRLQRSVREAMRDLVDGDTEKHLYFGKGINAKEAYRPDRRFFESKKLPSDMPEIAISILVDMSGSMINDQRDEAARKAALLLYDFCSGLGIPVSVCGHTTRPGEVYYHVFSDFDRIGDKDKYRIAKIKGDYSGKNRDGYALALSASRLAKRREEIKMLFIICDGRPNHDGYSGDVAKKEIQNIVQHFERQGVKFLAFAIADDKDRIRDIYKEKSFLDITDLNKLPKTMANLVKRKLLDYAS